MSSDRSTSSSRVSEIGLAPAFAEIARILRPGGRLTLANVAGPHRECLAAVEAAGLCVTEVKACSECGVAGISLVAVKEGEP